MDSDSECDRRSVSKANTTQTFEARARKGRRFQGLTQAAAVSSAEALEDVSEKDDAHSDESSHKIILPLSGHKTFLDVLPEDRYQKRLNKYLELPKTECWTRTTYFSHHC